MSAQPWEPRIAHLEGAFEQFEKRLDDFRAYVTQRFDQIDGRFDQIDARLDRMDDRFDRMDGRLDRMDGRFDRVERKIDEHFRWIVGMFVIAILAPIVTHVIGK